MPEPEVKKYRLKDAAGNTVHPETDASIVVYGGTTAAAGIAAAQAQADKIDVAFIAAGGSVPAGLKATGLVLEAIADIH